MLALAAKIKRFLPLNPAELPLNPPKLPVVISNGAGFRSVASHSLRSRDQKGMN